MHIHDLPPELHVDIVASACTEITSPSEPSTVQSVSLVSSYWCDVARPFKYQSLRIAGSRHIAKLLERFESLPMRERRVRYLSLSDFPLEESMAWDVEHPEQQRANIVQLLALVMPSLYVLELHITNYMFATSVFAQLWQFRAPHLVSLSIKGYYPFPTPPLRPSTSDASKFPRLEHLSLNGVANPSGLLSFNSLDRMFPKLETLKVRGLRGAVAFAHEVNDAIKHREQGSKVSASRGKAGYVPRLPSTLRSLSLFAEAVPRGGNFSKRGHAVHLEMMNVLMPLATRRTPKTESNLQVIVEIRSTSWFVQ